MEHSWGKAIQMKSIGSYVALRQRFILLHSDIHVAILTRYTVGLVKISRFLSICFSLEEICLLMSFVEVVIDL